MSTLTLETALSERDVAALHEWQEQQRKRVAELEVALDFERSEVARLMNLLIEAQANGNHLRRALEWAIAKMQGRDVYQCPYPCPDGQHGEDGRCLGTLEGCWMIAALAATKEAQP